MSKNDDVIANLTERRGKIEAKFTAGFGNSAREIKQTLEALDHPFSFYVILTTDERESIRLAWRQLAANQGVSLENKVKPKKVQDEIPANVAEFFGGNNCIPYRPRATNDPTCGTRQYNWRKASGLRSVELNPPAQMHWLIFDCDHQDTDRWRQVGLCEPTFITVNPENGHHHVVYKLASSVCTSIQGRDRPINYMYAVREALRVALNGDPAYVGLLTKNPLHPAWRLIRPLTMPSYTLKELANGLVLKPKAKRRCIANEAVLQAAEKGSRNRTLFDEVRRWAYSNENGPDTILEYAHQCNSRLPVPLRDKEVASTARSIAKYCRSNNRNRRV
jgi:hypothetical protein